MAIEVELIGGCMDGETVRLRQLTPVLDVRREGMPDEAGGPCYETYRIQKRGNHYVGVVEPAAAR